MSSPIAGILAAWGVTTGPDGADLCDALSVRDALKSEANRSQYLYELAPSLFAVEFLSTTIGWVAPAGVQQAFAVGCGGGGGGGGGYGGSTIDDQYALAGGGGGAAPVGCVPIPIVGGGLYDIWLGGGGSAGAAGFEGGMGGASYIVRQTGALTLATFRGASGGAGYGTYAGVTGSASHLGGMPWEEDSGDHWVGWGSRKLVIFDPGGSPYSSGSFMWPLPPGSGGAAVARGAGRNGRPSAVVFGDHVGGLGAAGGTHIGATRGGGGGGGGGGGPWGAGGAGGLGGNANAVLAVRHGTAGANAPANSGAGGGGGGAGAANAVTPGNGAAGGTGGSGRMIIVYGVKG